MSTAPRSVTVTLNTSIDQTVSIPNFTPGEVNRVAREQSDAGGKGVNVAYFPGVTVQAEKINEVFATIDALAEGGSGGVRPLWALTGGCRTHGLSYTPTH